MSWKFHSLSSILFQIFLNTTNNKSSTQCFPISYLYPGEGGPDVLQGHGGEEGGHQLVLEQGPGGVAPPGLTDHLGCHGEEPLQYVLGAWRSGVPSPVPRAGGPHQQVADSGRKSASWSQVFSRSCVQMIYLGVGLSPGFLDSMEETSMETSKGVL